MQSEIRQRTLAGLKVGDNFTADRTFTEEDVLKFSEITRDYNPVHFDERFSAVKKFNGRICHGLLVASILTEIGGQIGWLASVMNFRFKRPVYLHDKITCTITITQIDPQRRAKAIAVYKNQDDTIVLEADLEGILPGAPELEVLSAMVAEGDPTNLLNR
jgi:3-hydroxybutyryl-CoA dehydratase